jgi:hypothetical protein
VQGFSCETVRGTDQTGIRQPADPAGASVIGVMSDPRAMDSRRVREYQSHLQASSTWKAREVRFSRCKYWWHELAVALSVFSVIALFTGVVRPGLRPREVGGEILGH